MDSFDEYGEKKPAKKKKTDDIELPFDKPDDTPAEKERKRQLRGLILKKQRKYEGKTLIKFDNFLNEGSKSVFNAKTIKYLNGKTIEKIGENSITLSGGLHIYFTASEVSDVNTAVDEIPNTLKEI